MKIGDSGNDKALGDAVILERTRVRTQDGQTPAGVARGPKDSEEREARINVGLGRMIQSEFDLTRSAAERRQKIEELKALVAAGKYQPDSREVAQAVGEEIALAVMTEGARFGEEE
jgi:hypothetical protein